MLAQEAKLITKSVQNGNDGNLSVSSISKILNKIKNEAKKGNPDMVVPTLSLEKIDYLQKLGYAIFKHKEFNVPTGNHVISWFCDPSTSFSV